MKWAAVVLVAGVVVGAGVVAGLRHRGTGPRPVTGTPAPKAIQTFTSEAAVFGTLPAERRPPKDGKWHEYPLLPQAAEQWYDANVKGHRFVDAVHFCEAEPLRDGSISVLFDAGAVPAMGFDRGTTICATFPASAMPTLAKVKRGQKVTVSGTIEGVRLRLRDDWRDAGVDQSIDLDDCTLVP